MENDRNNEVVVVDIKIPFMSLVTLMVKFAIAAIPAMLILGFLFSVVFGLLHGITGGGSFSG